MASERDDGHMADRLGVASRADQGPTGHGAVEEEEVGQRPRRRHHRRSARARPGVLAAIAAGGALGAAARYWVAQVLRAPPGSFPWATFWTNVSGSLLLGAVVVLIAERFPPSRYLRPILATGFLGAYTTCSTFALETDVLVKDGHVSGALAYVAASLGAGLAAVWLGMGVARLLPLRRRRGRP